MPISADDVLAGQISGVTPDAINARLALVYIQTLASMDSAIGELRRDLASQVAGPDGPPGEDNILHKAFGLCDVAVAEAGNAQDRAHREIRQCVRNLVEVAAELRRQCRALDASPDADAANSRGAPWQDTERLRTGILRLAEELMPPAELDLW